MDDFQQIFLRDKTVPKAFWCGFVRFDRMPHFDLNHIVWSRKGAAEVSLAFFGKADDPRKMPLINFMMFRLPSGKEAFMKELDFWSHDRKKWGKLGDGSRFEPHMFSLREVPIGWHHDAFASSRGFIHVYTGPKAAIIVRFLLSRQATSADPFANHAANHFHVEEGTWDVQPPPTKQKKLPPAAKDVALPKEVAAKLRGAARRGLEYLELNGLKAKPEEIQRAIQAVLEKLAAGTPLPRNKVEELAVELGSLWGQALCDSAGWNWRKVTYTNGQSYFAVANKDRSSVVAPLHFIQDQLGRRGKNRDITSLLLFNLITSKGAPPDARPKGYRMLR